MKCATLFRDSLLMTLLRLITSLLLDSLMGFWGFGVLGFWV